VSARIWIARHGETDWNRDGRYQGQLESTLTERGRAQAAALATALRESGARRVISSPLSRCVQTAQPVADALGVALETSPLLIEIAHGTWEGRLREEVEREDPEQFAAWRSAPESVHFAGGERLSDVAQRWNAFASSLVEMPTIVVTHDVLVRLAILIAQQRPLAQLWSPRVVNGGFATCEIAGGEWTLIDECSDAHLGALVADTSGQAL
jgi:probable phosphoglycerate mutase